GRQAPRYDLVRHHARQGYDLPHPAADRRQGHGVSRVRESLVTDRPRILFVDDDEHILNGIRNLLRRRRHEWDLVYAIGPDAALEALAVEPFDIVVSDVRMPKMSGIELLQLVRREHPTTMRVVLTGFAGPGRERGDFTVAHAV